MEQKQKDIWLYSNPDTVKRRVIRYLPEGFEQYICEYKKEQQIHDFKPTR